MLFVKSFEPVGWHFTQDMLFIPKSQCCRTGDPWTTSHWSMLMVWQFWTWPDQAHISPQDVVKLRKFVQLKTAQKISDGCDPGVSFCRMTRADSFRVFHHRTKFINCKYFPLVSSAPLTKYHRARRSQPDGDGNDSQNWGYEQQCRSNASNIEDALPDRHAPWTGCASQSTMLARCCNFVVCCRPREGRKIGMPRQ